MKLAWPDDRLGEVCRARSQLESACGQHSSEVMLLLSIVRCAQNFKEVTGFRCIRISHKKGVLVLTHKNAALHVRLLDDEDVAHSVTTVTELPDYALTSAFLVEDLVVSGRPLRRR